MDIRERLTQLQQAHAQHVQLLQQTQTNIVRLEGAMEILNEQIRAEDAALSAKVVPLESRKQRRARRTKAEMAQVNEVAPPTQPA